MKYIKQSIERPSSDLTHLKESVVSIIDQVRLEGDDALFKFNAQFDLNERKSLRVTEAEIKNAYDHVPVSLIEDLKIASDHIKRFATAQKSTITDLPSFMVAPGIELGHRVVPIESCLCYVPGGNYPLFSSALMLVIPAKVAGVKRVVACSPSVKGTEHIAPETLVALDIAGVDEIYVVGGAHAIAAFSYGTESIKPVDLIVGPGNQYVTEAKRQCYGQIGIDFVAGPSEVMILADDHADPEMLAADLLAQSEHDLLAKGILVTTSETIALQTLQAVENQLKSLETADIARKSWEVFGEIIVIDHLNEGIDLCNRLAPEHLELAIQEPESIIDQLYNYGSLFIGEWSAEVLGDYISGTNHTLPTLKAARYTGGVYVGTFLKTLTHQTIKPEALKKIGPSAYRMAKSEGLHAHANAVDVRLKRL
ncbi:histidinol dehydrogenase [Fusibacter ferrireducens]|uniref:Histidinol dehydrogenase n=1 Tax=Fusibacter ferrireducens TaxID=2785058 RepID=A0ABR9ZXL9_9FIRM|nr:histidinol dehydrogenase [Fusibacter ferrireducens]MBF4695200.1 histidinol dehydrogenase [Fusibacter ferrireducens]